LPGERLLEIPIRIFEQALDLLEREPQRAQRHDVLEPNDLLLAIEAVPGVGAITGLEQSEFIPVVKRAHGETGISGEFANLEPCLAHDASPFCAGAATVTTTIAFTTHPGTSRGVRFKGFFAKKYQPLMENFEAFSSTPLSSSP